MEKTLEVPVRISAGVFDLNIPSPSQKDESFGVGASPDAIGGYYGVGWYEYFRDSKTGEIYKVSCSDGVNGGHGPYSRRDEEWLEAAENHILDRCRNWMRVGGKAAEVSPNEATILRKQAPRCWEICEDGLMQGKSYLAGITVVVDSTRTDDLPSR